MIIDADTIGVSVQQDMIGLAVAEGSSVCLNVLDQGSQPTVERIRQMFGSCEAITVAGLCLFLSLKLMFMETSTMCT